MKTLNTLTTINATVKAAVNNCFEPVLITSVENLVILYANKSANEYFESPEGVIIFRNIDDFISLDDKLKQELKNIPYSGQRHWELEQKTGAQDERKVSFNITKIQLDGQEALIFTFHNTDITVEAEHEFREFLSKLKHSFEGIAHISKDGKYKSVNTAYAEMFGLKSENLIGCHWKNSTKEELHEKYDASYKKMVEKGSDRFEITGERSDGTPYYVEVNLVASYDRKLKFNGHYRFLKDITEKKEKDLIKKRRSKELELINETSSLMLETLDLNSLYERIYQIISQYFDCNGLFVTSYDSVKKMIKYEFIRDSRGECALDIKNISPIPLAPRGEGIISEVIHTGEAIIINNYEERFKKTRTVITLNSEGERIDSTENSYVAKSSIIVPLIYGSQVEGVIQILSTNKNAFNTDQLNLLSLLVKPLALASHNAKLYEKAQNEISHRIRAEQEIKKSVSEKELLLKEIHHRVKNNLQIISSLLRLQGTRTNAADKDKIEFITTIQNRVKSMLLVHEKLYKNNFTSNIDLKDYINSIVSNLVNSYKTGISFVQEVDDIYMDLDTAIPCGLIINELVTNSIKHAFGNDSNNDEIKVTMKETETGKYHLQIKDNGAGFDGAMSGKSNSLGLNLVKNLVGQLGGHINIRNDNGTDVSISILSTNYNERF